MRSALPACSQASWWAGSWRARPARRRGPPRPGRHRAASPTARPAGGGGGHGRNPFLGGEHGRVAAADRTQTGDQRQAQILALGRPFDRLAIGLGRGLDPAVEPQRRGMVGAIFDPVGLQRDRLSDGSRGIVVPTSAAQEDAEVVVQGRVVRRQVQRPPIGRLGRVGMAQPLRDDGTAAPGDDIVRIAREGFVDQLRRAGRSDCSSRTAARSDSPSGRAAPILRPAAGRPRRRPVAAARSWPWPAAASPLPPPVAVRLRLAPGRLQPRSAPGRAAGGSPPYRRARS